MNQVGVVGLLLALSTIVAWQLMKRTLWPASRPQSKDSRQEEQVAAYEPLPHKEGTPSQARNRPAIEILYPALTYTDAEVEVE